MPSQVDDQIDAPLAPDNSNVPPPSAPPLPPPSYDDVMSDIAPGSGAAVAGPSAPSAPRRRISGGKGTGGPFSDDNFPQSPDTALPVEESQPLIHPQSSTVPGHHPHNPAELSSREFFASLEYKRTSKGYSSSDEWLNTDAMALHRFLSECNERPRVSVEVVGSHMEDRVVERTYNENGQTRRESHTHQDRIVDFKFTLELTPYIHEKGNLFTARTSTGEPYDITKVLSDYVKAENILKELRVQKKVIWDYDLVRREVTGYIQSLGYPHSVTVSFPMEHDRIVVKSHSDIARVWRHPVTSFLCFITCACLVGWPIQYFATRRWKNKIMSDFVVVASPRDFVARNIEFIRNQVSWSARPYPFPMPSSC